jgi:hypothetical protein
MNLPGKHATRPDKGFSRFSAEDPPGDPSLERLVLGAVFASPDADECFKRLRALVGESTFTLEKYRLSFCAMASLADRQAPITLATVASELQLGKVRVAGLSISEFAGLPEIANLAGMCALLRDYEQRRSILVELEAIRTRTLNRDPVSEIATEARATLAKIGQVARLKNSDAEQPITRIEDLPRLSGVNSKQVRFAIPGILPLGAITVISSESGHGKSYFLLWALSRVTQGKPVFKRLTIQCPVLYLDRENPSGVIQERVRDLGIDPDDPLLNYWGTHISEDAPAPDSTIVIEWAQRNPDSVIVIDSQVAFMEGDENSSTDVSAFYAPLRRLASLGPAVTVLHHTGKSETSKEYRGSSYIKGAIDVGFNLTNFGGNRLGKMRLRAWKPRMSVDPELIFEYRSGDFISDERRCAAEQTVTTQLTALLRANPGILTGEFESLALAKGLGRDRARQFLEFGGQTGDIKCEPDGKRGKRYFLTERTDDAFLM